MEYAKLCFILNFLIVVTKTQRKCGTFLVLLKMLLIHRKPPLKFVQCHTTKCTYFLIALRSCYYFVSVGLYDLEWTVKVTKTLRP